MFPATSPNRSIIFPSFYPSPCSFVFSICHLPIPLWLVFSSSDLLSSSVILAICPLLYVAHIRMEVCSLFLPNIPPISLLYPMCGAYVFSICIILSGFPVCRVIWMILRGRLMILVMLWRHSSFIIIATPPIPFSFCSLFLFISPIDM